MKLKIQPAAFVLGDIAAKAEYDRSSGEAVRTSTQALDRAGVPLWTVTALTMGGEVRVTVAATVPPPLAPEEPIEFDGLYVELFRGGTCAVRAAAVRKAVK